MNFKHFKTTLIIKINQLIYFQILVYMIYNNHALSLNYQLRLLNF